MVIVQAREREPGKLHVQVGMKGSYAKFDVPGTAKSLVGLPRNTSLYGSDTEYFVVAVRAGSALENDRLAAIVGRL